MSMDNATSNIGVGFTAYGMSGQVFHSPLVQDTQGLELVAAVERSKNLLPARFPNAKQYRTLDQLLADDAVQLVVVNTPQAFHFQQAEAALEAGKHVVLEKPAALTYAQCQHLQKLASDKGLLLQVFQNRRWDNDFLTLLHLRDQGALAGLTYYESTFHRWRPDVDHTSWKEQPEEGSGLLYNLGSHLIDQALVLLGMPFKVSARLRAERPGAKVIDSFHVTLYYASGTEAHLKSSYLVAAPEPKFLLRGMFGSYVKYGLDGQEAALKASMLPSQDPAWGADPEQDFGTLYSFQSGTMNKRVVPTLQGRYQDFYAGIVSALNGGTHPVPDDFPFQTIRIIEAAMLSAARGAMVEL